MNLLEQLNSEYLTRHSTKEEAFWAEKMGLKEYQKGSFEAREIELKAWVSSPRYLTLIREALRAPTLSASEKVGLEGWLHFFEVNVIEDPKVQTLQAELIAAEGRLAQKRAAIELGYKDPDTGTFVPKSYGALSLLVSTSSQPALRKAAWEGMGAIGPYVLQNGFLEVVKRRNELAHALGYEDYYDYKVQLTEGFSKATLFKILDDLEENTQQACQASLDQAESVHGPEVKKPWSFGFLTSGNTKIKLDPYFSLPSALERWGRTFAGLGIKYSGASLRLDLLNRKGKYENGFMHGPYPSWIDGSTFRPARINFTANAIPTAVGSGFEALNTLFHEGGHAAHFSNIRMPAPCFSQEFAPTSVAFAETQSMFLDGIVHDADWLMRYARSEAGEPIPRELIKEVVTNDARFRAKMLRSILCVSYCEKAIYELPPEQLTASRIIELVSVIEQRLHCQEASPRPVLSIPHILSGESSAYYHGYVLAEMAVYQTRAYFLQKYGFITDNPAVGPELREAYWKSGNAYGFLTFIEQLTRKPFSAQATIELVTKPLEKVWREAEASMQRAEGSSGASGPIDLDAAITMAHGDEVISRSDASSSFESMAARFGQWVRAQTTQAAVH